MKYNFCKTTAWLLQTIKIKHVQWLFKLKRENENLIKKIKKTYRVKRECCNELFYTQPMKKKFGQKNCWGSVA